MINKKIIYIIFSITFLMGYDFKYDTTKNNLDIEIVQNVQKHEQVYFKDSNSSEILEKSFQYPQINLSGNFNEIIGFKYEKSLNVLNDSDISRRGFYIGTREIPYISIIDTEKTLNYNTLNTNSKIHEINFLNIVKTSNEKFTSNEILRDSLDTKDVKVIRKYELDKYAITTEGIYDKVKEDAYEGKEYFYGIAFSQKYDNFKLYGIGIFGFEKYSFSKGDSYYEEYQDVNGTKKLVVVPYYSLEAENNMKPERGKYKSLSYGYKVTLEYQYKNFEMFGTIYSKVTKFENEKDEKNFISANPTLRIKDFTTKNSFIKYGIRYRF